MEPLKPKIGRPEAKVQKALIKELSYLGWFIKPTHGSAYQSGFPDLFACHSKYGQRWIEVKLPNMEGSKFTAAQLENFPKFCANGSGVWVLTGHSSTEINKLFKPSNWWTYLEMYK